MDLMNCLKSSKKVIESHLNKPKKYLANKIETWIFNHKTQHPKKIPKIFKTSLKKNVQVVKPEGLKKLPIILIKAC